MWPAIGCGPRRATCSRGPSACTASCFGRRGRQARQPAWEPPVDILETEFEVLALVALPGVDAENAQAVIEDGDLVIAGTRVLPRAIAHRDHSSARTAARAVLPAAAAAGRALQRGAPHRRRRLSGDYVAESEWQSWLKKSSRKVARRNGGGGGALPPLPADALIIVPVRNTVLFPGLVLPITLGRPKSVAAAQQAVRDQRQVGILLQRAAEVDDPTAHRHASHGHARQYRALHHRAGRHASPGLPGRAALSRSSNISAAGRFWSRACCEFPSPKRAPRRSRRASSI